MRQPALWKPSEVLRGWANKVIKKYPAYLEMCEPDRIGYMTVTDTHARWFGVTYKVREPFKTALDDEMDYIIVINMNKIYDLFAKESRLNAIRIVLLHELRHILGAGKLRRHTVEDFLSMLEKLGINYLDSVQPPNILAKKYVSMFEKK